MQNVLLLETRAPREYMGKRKVNDKAKSTQEMTATCALYLKSADGELRLSSTTRMHLARVAHWCRRCCATPWFVTQQTTLELGPNS